MELVIAVIVATIVLIAIMVIRNRPTKLEEPVMERAGHPFSSIVAETLGRWHLEREIMGQPT